MHQLVIPVGNLWRFITRYVNEIMYVMSRGSLYDDCSRSICYLCQIDIENFCTNLLKQTSALWVAEQLFFYVMLKSYMKCATCFSCTLDDPVTAILVFSLFIDVKDNSFDKYGTIAINFMKWKQYLEWDIRRMRVLTNKASYSSTVAETVRNICLACLCQIKFRVQMLKIACPASSYWDQSDEFICDRCDPGTFCARATLATAPGNFSSSSVTEWS